jgi:hypothetical protein
MLIKPFTPLFKDQRDPTTMSYLGLVEDNNDPEKLGRVRVRVAPYADLNTDELPWASPMLGSYGNISTAGGLNIPELGAQVRVSFPNRDFTAPYYSGAELNELNRTTFFDDNYPNTYGYKDSTGNFIKVNKETGTIQIQHSSTTNLQVAPSGSVRVTLNGGAYMIFDHKMNFGLNIGTLDVSGSADGTLAITANNEVDINSDLNVSGNVKVKGELSAGNGYSGTFMAQGNFVTVKDGIIVSVD